MLETKESISEIVITFCKKCPSFDCVLKRGPGIELSSRLVRTWFAYLIVTYSFFSSRAVFENSRVRFRNLPGYFLLNSLSYNLGTS